MRFLSDFHVSRLCPNRVRTRAAWALGADAAGGGGDVLECFHLWESRVKPRTPSPLADLKQRVRGAGVNVQFVDAFWFPDRG